MPNELTDAEVKKALECCSAGVCKAECFGYFITGTNDCTTQLAKYALDLINRQEGENKKNENIIRIADKTITTLNAENESLKEKNSNLTSDLTSLQNDLTSAKAEVERLQSHIQEGIDLAKQIPEMVALAKAEAYKEVADNIERAFSKTESQIPNDAVVKKTVQICRNAIRKVLNELVSDGDDHE